MATIGPTCQGDHPTLFQTTQGIQHLKMLGPRETNATPNHLSTCAL